MAEPDTQQALPEAFTLVDDFPPVAPSAWREQVERDLRGAPFDKKLVSRTYEALHIQPVYTAQDRPDADPGGGSSGRPGAAPFTRGATAPGPHGGGWALCQEHTDPDLHATSAHIHEDLARGVDALLLRYDAAARFAFDADDPMARHLSAHDGLPIYSLSGLDRVLDGVHLNMIGLCLEAGAGFLPAAGQVVGLLRHRGIDPAQARGHLNADPLAVLARRGELPGDAELLLAHAADLACYTHSHLPRFTALRVGTGPYHHAGATAAQDVAFALASGLTYLKAMVNAGLSPDDAAGQVLFNFNLGANFFLAAAKLRAARRVWSEVATRCGVSPAHAAMRIHARTSKRLLTQRDPWVNLLRGTATTFAAAIGGAQLITVEPFDKALGLPDAFSRRVARNTSVILSEECHLGRVVDPAGGSWFLESLTDDLARAAWDAFRQVEAAGGMLQALRSGWVEQQIDSAFAPRAANIASRRDAITGVSEFPNLTERPVPRRVADEAAIRRDASAWLSEHRETLPLDLLDGVQYLANDPTPAPGALTAAVVEAVARGATTGQVGEALYADHLCERVPPISPHPYAAPFEQLRDASDRLLESAGFRPRVALLNLGPEAKHAARRTYAHNFFEAGGFHVVHSDPLTGEPAELASAAATALDHSGAAIACLCSSDDLYLQLAGDVAWAVKSAGARRVILAGHPGDAEANYRNAGVDTFIYIKCDVLATLTELLHEEGAF